MPSKYFVARGEGVVTDITPASAGWGYSGLRVVDLAPGESTEFVADGIEFIVLPLSGLPSLHWPWVPAHRVPPWPNSMR